MTVSRTYTYYLHDTQLRLSQLLTCVDFRRGGHSMRERNARMIIIFHAASKTKRRKGNLKLNI